ncbi:hypothetical protein Ahy_B10g101748 [Arachis hypogaea]|uniref:Uncharacterized protein n=1 Tax=Arachis hypogaea TaxID=3818 RepID=A0A444X0E6_ARAHY|nr:hypothetical protein Ahy_B10g101748 [Arachis hypogaea]
MDPPIRDSESKPKPLSENKDDANVVFIDTNLDTHLAVLVSDHDTVSDLKGLPFTLLLSLSSFFGDLLFFKCRLFSLSSSVLNVYDFVQLLRRSALALSMFEKIDSFVF